MYCVVTVVFKEYGWSKFKTMFSTYGGIGVTLMITAADHYKAFEDKSLRFSIVKVGPKSFAKLTPDCCLENLGLPYA